MHLLLQTQKESILIKLKSVFEEEVDWWSEMSENEQEEIKTGLTQAANEEYIANETAMKRFDQWR